jgi:hypothetical protein
LFVVVTDRYDSNFGNVELVKPWSNGQTPDHITLPDALNAVLRALDEAVMARKHQIHQPSPLRRSGAAQADGKS